ncbi:hypothetical protein [Acidovorax lacteus]|uniref:Uncharacterized protein n=1 Tax=Acidovorax lacteus TaxID=1924988 RepID=A0ABP8L6H3_9BURK
MLTPHYHAPQFDPTVDELTVLKQLEMGERATVTDALRAHWSHRLEERGFVSRLHDGALSLTSAGRALIRRQ